MKPLTQLSPSLPSCLSFLPFLLSFFLVAQRIDPVPRFFALPQSERLFDELVLPWALRVAFIHRHKRLRAVTKRVAP